MQLRTVKEYRSVSENRLRKIIGSKLGKYNIFSFFIGLALFCVLAVFVRINYDKIFSDAGYLYMYIPLFFVILFSFSFGNLIFFSFMFFVSGKVLSGRSDYNRVLFSLSLSVMPVILILLLSIPEFLRLKMDFVKFIPVVKINGFFLLFHIIMFFVRIITVLISCVLMIQSIQIIQKFTFFKATINFLIGILIPIIISFLFYLYFNNLYLKYN